MLTPFVSVIIPVYNDAPRLARCLNALDAQTYPKDSFEIIVVDNGSDDNLARVVADFPLVRLVCESIKSQFAARNTGMSVAKGDLFAFTDADCVPDHRWIETAVNLLQGKENMVLGGRVVLCFQDKKRPTSTELYDQVTGFLQKIWVERCHFGATANLFVWRQNMDLVGRFDNETTSGGDVEWGQRAFSRGCNLVYSDECWVSHPARRTLRELYTKVTRTIGGVHYFRNFRKNPNCSFVTLERNVLHDFAPPAILCMRLFRDNKQLTLSQKVRVVPIFFFVRYAEALERIRLQFGGNYERR